MDDSTSSYKRRSLEDLNWSSLTSREKLVVAAMLERAGAGGTAHLDMIAEELREDALQGLAIPVVLTPRQNRAVAEALEKEADGLELLAAGWVDSPAIARTGHYVAGYVHSLVDRLIKGGRADPEASLERIAQLLLVERSGSDAPANPAEMVERACLRLKALGLGNVLWPVIEEYAVRAAEVQTGSPEVDPYDFEIVDATEERRLLAQRAFEAALVALWDDDSGWDAFRAELDGGRIADCEAAPEYPAVASNAANAALAIAAGLRAHLRETSDVPWEAVNPGLKAILDRFPALKGLPRLDQFVRRQVQTIRPAATD